MFSFWPHTARTGGDFANVQKVSSSSEIPNADHGRLPTGFDARDLRRKTRYDEIFRLAWTGMAKRRRGRDSLYKAGATRRSNTVPNY